MNNSVPFAYPFRIFFLSLAVWAVLAMALWLVSVSGAMTFQFAVPALLWHQHEMVFALLHAAIAGFLLTAVCVWTGTERLHGNALVLLWLVWLAGRAAITIPGLPETLVVSLNLLFLPLVMIDAGRRIIATRQSRHAPILVILLLLWLAQAAFLLGISITSLQVALIAASALMLVIGGRITPAFSGNWLRTRGGDPGVIHNPLWLERLTLAVMLLLCVVLPFASSGMIALLALLAAIISVARISLWRGWLVRAEPLLWILHLSLLWIPFGLLLLAGSRVGLWPDNVWIHALGVGAMASLILGVISRVSLGHTGRPLILPSGIAAAFVLIQAAAILRVLTALQLIPWLSGATISAMLWLAAWLLFLLRYTAILLRPRADGKPG
ncbi:MAG: NnrS family protein [Alcanivoracaceae bacterium]